MRTVLTTLLASLRGVCHERRDARDDHATAERVKRYLAADREMNVEDLFALQLEEIRSLPEVGA
jgi:hypothetical protein